MELIRFDACLSPDEPLFSNDGDSKVDVDCQMDDLGGDRGLPRFS